MILIQRPAGSKLLKVVVIGLVGGMLVFTFLATFSILFCYSMIMPRSPQPETGRIYRMRGPQYGNWVYVNKKELDRWNFIEDYMIPASGASALVLFFIGRRFGWFKKGPG